MTTPLSKTAATSARPPSPAASATPTPTRRRAAPQARERRERVACVELPHVAVAVEVRDDSRLAGRPLVVETPRPGPRAVYDLSYEAHLAGVARGMSLQAARRTCPDLLLLPPRMEAYHDTFRLMIALLGELAPAVEPVDLEHSWLAAGELASRRVVEVALAEELVARVRRETGLPTRVGLAHGKLTSRIVTRYLERRDTMVLPAGREVVFLGGLATRYLPLEAADQRRLRSLGLAKIRQYAALPGAGILPRFGYQGLRAWRLAHGRDDAQVRPWQAEPILEAEHVFLEPIANHRSVRHHIERLVRQVARPLATQFRMAGSLALAVEFEDGGREEQERTLLEPTAGTATLLAQADGLLRRIEWRAPVERLTVRARGLCPTVGRQLSLFRAEVEDRLEIEGALRDLQGRYGPEAVRMGRIAEPASPLPERRAYLQTWQGGNTDARAAH